MFSARIEDSGFIESGRFNEKFSLSPEEVHIWWIDLNLRGATVCACWDLLSPEEKQTSLRYRFAKDRREFVGRRAMLRQVVAQYCDGLAVDLCFDTDFNGKPILRGMPALHFNLSHSRHYALLAIARRAVGIDLEFMQPNCMRQSVIEQFLSTSEYSQLEVLPAKERCEALFRCWTRKEAVLKATGLGLLYPARQLSVPSGTETAQVVRVLGREWFVWQVATREVYAAAAAIEKSRGKLQCRQFAVRDTPHCRRLPSFQPSSTVLTRVLEA